MSFPTKSRTINRMLIAEGLNALLIVSHLWQPIVSQETFIIIQSVLNILIPMYAIYMRTITTESLAEK